MQTLKLGGNFLLKNSGSYHPFAQAIFNKMVSLGEPPSLLVKQAYNKTILDLIANNLWADTDSIQTHRTHAENSSFINWKTGLVQGSKVKTTGNYPVFTINSGWQTDGSSNFINTGINPTNCQKYTLNDAGLIFKTAKTTGDGNYSLGAYGTSTNRIFLMKSASGTNARGTLNAADKQLASLGDANTNKAGYWGISRKSSSLIDAMKDDAAIIDQASTAAASLINKDIYIGCQNHTTPGYTSEQSELIIVCSKFTPTQFLKFKEIFDTFFYELDIALAEDVTLHGAVADGETDNYTAITNALATYNSIRIGNSRSDVFLTTKEILIPSKKTVIVDGTVKIKDGTTVNIVQNVAVSGKDFYTNSVTGFNIGELVGWSDDLQDVQGGGVQTRKVGGCGYISAIDVDNKIITVDYGSKYAITASSNAKLGHYQNVFKISISSKNIHIYGDGKIDGNMSNQLDIEGVYNDALSMEYGGSGLFIRQCNNVTIKGRNQLEVTNSVLHGISFLGGATYQSKNIVIDKVKSHLNHDKNALFYNTDNSIVSNYIGDDSLFEDGLIYYVLNTNAIVNNISCKNNRRGGFYANSNSNFNVTGDNIELSGNKMYDVVINSSNVTLSNVNIIGKPLVSPRYSVLVSYAYEYGKTIVITNMNIDGIINPLYGVIGLIGGIDGVTFNNAKISNCSGIAIVSDDGVYAGFPQNVHFIGGGIYNHTGTKTDIQAGSDVTFTDFEGLT